MNGYKTYTGAAVALITAVLTLLGANDLVQGGEVEQIVTSIAGILGAILAIYGRFDKEKRDGQS